MKLTLIDCRLAAGLGTAALLAIAAPLAAQETAEAPAAVSTSTALPEGNSAAEVAERQAANEAQLKAAQEQIAQNAANQAAYERAMAEYQAQLAAIEQQKAANETEVARIEREQAEALAKWEADKAACEDGDKTRCGPMPDEAK